MTLPARAANTVRRRLTWKACTVFAFLLTPAFFPGCGSGGTGTIDTAKNTQTNSDQGPGHKGTVRLNSTADFFSFDLTISLTQTENGPPLKVFATVQSPRYADSQVRIEGQPVGYKLKYDTENYIYTIMIFGGEPTMVTFYVIQQKKE